MSSITEKTLVYEHESKLRECWKWSGTEALYTERWKVFFVNYGGGWSLQLLVMKWRNGISYYTGCFGPKDAAKLLAEKSITPPSAPAPVVA